MSNFEFLGVHSKALATLGATAEKIFPLDPTSCALKLRLLPESINQDAAARLQATHTATELLRRLRESRAALGV